MRLLFMGTSAFAVPSLRELVAGPDTVAAVVTQPDRPGGRGQRLRPSPVREAADSLGLSVWQPETLGLSAFRAAVVEQAPDAVVVVAYGKLIPDWLIGLPHHGVVNVHGSLLPRYRGAAPINWAIARGESRTGVCTMRIDSGLDTGPVFDCRETGIDGEETAPELTERLSHMGASLLVETLANLQAGAAVPRPQDAGQATFAPRLRRDDGHIRWEEPAAEIHDKVRGFLPWPGVVVGFRGRKCRILETRVGGPVSGSPSVGTLALEGARLRAVCGDGRALEILRVQMENRRAASGLEFSNGFHLEPGDRFDSLRDAGESPDRVASGLDCKG
jgi:methionyl-tRNA formyltransferase